MENNLLEFGIKKDSLNDEDLSIEEFAQTISKQLFSQGRDCIIEVIDDKTCILKRSDVNTHLKLTRSEVLYGEYDYIIRVETILN